MNKNIMNKTEINLNFKFKGLDGIEDTSGQTAGQIVAQFLASYTKGDALKLFTWAQDLYGGKSLSLDPSDTQTFKAFIEANESLTVLAKAQVLSVL